MDTYEINLDGMVGPTHHYGGLALGNMASMLHAEDVANPRAAALQGLAKMHLLAQRGVKQIVLPPHPRPAIGALRALGFQGTDAEILAAAAQQAPALLSSCCSASSMWVANCATVCPSTDSSDGRVHLTPATLVSNLHRSIEPGHTARLLREIFSDPRYFVHHEPLIASQTLGDEGSANHTRLANHYGAPGIQLFVYGRNASGRNASSPKIFPARQTAEASQAIARLHRLDPQRTVFAQQHPDAIDAGVFHNDVISVGNGPLFLYHERAFINTDAIISALQRAADAVGCQLHLVKISEKQLPLADAVKSYFFNSQIVTLPDGSMLMLTPQACAEMTSARRCCEELLASGGPIREIIPVDLLQSMRNGGGPACLRMRLVLNEVGLAAVKPSVFLTDALYGQLVSCVTHTYRDRLQLRDLADPALLHEARSALGKIHKLLGISSLI